MKRPFAIVLATAVVMSVVGTGLSPRRNASAEAGESALVTSVVTVCATGCDHTSIADAIADPGAPSTIDLGAGTYTESLLITRDVHLLGEGAATTVIDGGELARVIEVAAGVSVRISGVTITGGREVDPVGTVIGAGGGVLNRGTLTLSDSVISDNVAEEGGGIANRGTLRVEGSRVERNLAESRLGGGGGGISSFGPSASVTVVESSIDGNHSADGTTDFRGGGAIWSNFGDVTIEDSTVSANSSEFASGGLEVRGSGAELVIRRSSVSGNSSGNAGGLQIRNSARGTIDASTLDHNVASRIGGALVADGAVAITNSTISGNIAGTNGGALVVGSNGDVALDSVTITENRSEGTGGVAGSTTRWLVADNSVIAGNSGEESRPDCTGLVLANTPALIGNTGGCLVDADWLITGVDPLLGALADNGGPTRTHQPAPTSVLIDGGTTDLEVDQRGWPRPAGEAPDLGAVEVQSAPTDPDDTSPPTFADPTLDVTDITETSMRLEWNAAEDDTGVDRYEVLVDGVLAVTTTGAQTTAALVGLTPDTGYTVEIVAVDAAGNRSTAGPVARVRTVTPAPPGHLGPASPVPELDWAAQLPFELIAAAAGVGDVLIIGSAGNHPQVRRSVAPGTSTTLDLDADGVHDVTVMVRPVLGAGAVGLEVDYERNGAQPLDDVELLAIAGSVTDPLTSRTRSVLSGLRTLDANGGPGGQLPGKGTLRFDLDLPDGVDQRLGLGFDTVDPSGPMLLLGGLVDGAAATGAAAANVVSMSLDLVPTTVATEFELRGPTVDVDPATASANATLRWSSPESEPRPQVEFAHGRRSLRAATATEHATTVTVDRMAPSTELALNLAPDQPSTELASLRLTGASSAQPIEEISAEHRRADGVVIRAGLLKVDREVSVRVGGNGDLTFNDSSLDTRLFVELEHPAVDLLGGATSQPIRHLFASLRDRGGTTTATAGVAAGSDLRLQADGWGGGELVVVASSDPGDLALSDGWPTTDPRTWSYARGSTRDPSVDVALVDDGARSTLALHARSFSTLDITLDPESLDQAFQLGVDRNSTLQADVELAAGTPLGRTSGATMGCSAKLPTGPIGLVVRPPDRYGVDATGPVTEIDCSGEAGTRSATFSATRLPATSTISLVDVDGPRGAFELDFDGPLANDRPRDVVVEVFDRAGLLPAPLLGSPVTFLRLRGDGWPDTRVDWTTEGRTAVIIDSLHPEDAVEHLELVLSTQEPAENEQVLVPPAALEPGSSTIRSGDGSLRIWEQGSLRLLSAEVRSARSAELQYLPGDGRVVTELDVLSAYRFVSQVLVPEGGHFSPTIGLNGGCRLGLPIGLTVLEVTPAERVRATSSAGLPAVGVIDALTCDLSVRGGGRSPDVFASFAASSLPVVTDVSFADDRVEMFTIGGPTGKVAATLQDRSGRGFDGFDWMGRPLRFLGIQFDGAASLAATWAPSADGLETQLTATGVAGGADVARLVLNSDPMASLGAPPSSHRVRVVDEGAGRAGLDVAFAGLRSAQLNLDRGKPEVALTMSSDGEYPLSFEVRTDATSQLTPGIDGRVTATTSRTPDAFQFVTDLATSHRLSMSAGIAELHLDGWLQPSAGDRTEFWVDLGDLPANVRLHLDRLVAGSGPPAVSLGVGTLGSLDVVLSEQSDDGLFGSGSQRLRVRAEDIPLVLGIRFDETAGDGSLRLRGASGGRVGRVLVDSSTTRIPANHFGTDLQRFTAQVAGVPAAWELDVVAEDTGALEVGFTGDDGLGAAGTVDDAVDRVEFRAVRRVARDDSAAALSAFASPTAAAVQRGSYVAGLDREYWGANDADQLDQLYGVGLPLPLIEVPVGIAPDGQGGGTRTTPLQDHLIITGLDGSTFDTASVAISDVHTARARVSDDQVDVDVERPTGADPGPLYVGTSERANAGYGGRSSEDVLSALALQVLTSPNPFASPLYELVTSPSAGPEVKLLAEVTVAWDGSATNPPNYGLIDLSEVEKIDLSTFEVRWGPQHGQVGIDADGVVRYQSNSVDRSGRDAFVYRVCDTDGNCSWSVVTVTVAERYERIRAFQLLDPPTRLGVTVELRTGVADAGVDAVDIQGSQELGQFEYYEGAAAPLETPGSVDEMRVRGAIDSDDLRIGMRGLEDFLPGRVSVDSSGEVNLLALVGDRNERMLLSLRGEDLSVQTKYDGLFVDDADNALADYEGAGECNKTIDIACWLLFRIGIEVDGIGDVTGRSADGFFAIYKAVELDPSIGGGRDFVPRHTVGFTGLREADATFELELDFNPCLFFCQSFWPLDVETKLIALASAFEYGFWDLGTEVCLPLLKNTCVDLDDPDYLERSPWRLSFPPPAPVLPGFPRAFSPPPPQGTPLPLASTELVQGQTVEIVLPPGTSNYQVLLYSTPTVLAEGDAEGATSVTVRLPEDAELGEHTLVLVAEVGGELVVQRVEVTIGEDVPPEPDRDSVSIDISGGVDYSIAGPVTDGDIRVERDGFGVRRVSGRVATPGVAGEDATVVIDARRFLFFGSFVGKVSVVDPGASPRRIDVPILFRPVEASGDPITVSSTSEWFVPTGSSGVKPVTLRWSATDRVGPP